MGRHRAEEGKEWQKLGEGHPETPAKKHFEEVNNAQTLIMPLPWRHPATVWSLNDPSKSSNSKFNCLLVVHRTICLDQVHSQMLVSFLSFKKCYSLYRVEPLFLVLSNHSYIGFQIQNCDSIPAEYPKLFLRSLTEKKRKHIGLSMREFSFS